jgi:hypothetical protein
VKRANFVGSYIAAGLGALCYVSGSAQQPPNRVFAATGGVMLIGATAYLARKKQKFGGSKWWLALEIPALLMFALINLNSVLDSRWYRNPIPFLIVPVWSIVAYLVNLLIPAPTA